MAKLTIGVDFGTLSARALLIDAETGEELAEAVSPYAHGVMDTALPCGIPLPPHYALEHPRDYLESFSEVVCNVIRKANADPRDVVGIGLDFTTCTLLSLDGDGEPLCFRPEWEHTPLAYTLLWKHHAAQAYADEINKLADERNEPWMDDYGRKISSEWMFPKILQIAREEPALYRATAQFCEAGDWMIRVITGEDVHSACFAGIKSMWNAKRGYPSNDFFRALDPALDGIIGTKVSEKVLPVGGVAGRLNPRGARLTGLPEGVAVAVPVADAHTAMPALGVTDEGTPVLILGTSIVQLVHRNEEKPIPGICGFVTDGVIPGRTTYEAGQSGGGDIYDWYVRQVPASYEREAAERGISVHRLLREKVQDLPAGASGLLALDWVNGNRNPFQNGNLSGVMLGMTMTTKPEEIYRAWIESTAYGTRWLLENFERHGIPVRDICASGGIARKDPMTMRIFADITKKSIRVAGVEQGAARGSAIYAAVAGGVWGSIPEAARALRVPDACVYHPDPAQSRVYDRLYAEYCRLFDAFGRGENPVLETLSALRKVQTENR